MNLWEMLGTAAGVGFLAGIRLYATVLCLGMLLRWNLLPVPESFTSIGVLGSLPVILTAGVLTIAEFVSDKVPWFDSVWDTIHTFVRPIGAIALAVTASGGMDSGVRTAVILITGGVALSSHSAKAAARVAVNQSPEPFSNWVLSIAEDLFVPLGLWMTMHFPLVVLTLVAVFVLAVVVLIRLLIQFLRQRLFRSGSRTTSAARPT